MASHLHHRRIMLSDLRYAMRALRRYPSFSVVAILSIALGIGANAVMFSMADALLLRPLSVPQASRVVNLRSQLRGQSPSDMSFPDFADFKNKATSFAGLTAFELSQFGFARDKQVLPEMKAGLLVTGNFFDVLQVAPQLGRAFRADEDAVPGRDAVAVISDDTWTNDYQRSPDITGRALLVNGIEFKIIGVAPPSFPGVDQFFRPALYIPLMMSDHLSGDPSKKWMENRDDRRLNVKGRLKPGATLESAGAEARVIAASLASEYNRTNRDWTALVRTDIQSRVDMSPYDALLVVLLLALAGVVLVIACANVANLMLGRALSRSSEIAIRMAIGAGRWRLVRQLLSESLLVALAAGALGILFAQLCMDTFLPWRIPSEIPIEISARLDMRVLLYALCAAALSAVVCGLIPALRATRAEIEPALRAGGRNMEPRSRFLGRNALVVAQVAGSLFLLVCASQLYRGISYVLRQPAGFRSNHLLMAAFDPTLARYDEARTQEFYKQLIERVRALPGVASASVAELVPMANHPDIQLIAPEGFHMPPGKEAVSIYSNVISEDYFTTLAIPILRGRPFRSSDTADSPKVAVVNERFANSYFPNQDPLGKRIRLGGPQGSWVEIVGVAKMSHYAMLVEPPFEVLYLAAAQNPRKAMSLLLQTAGPSETLAQPLRSLVRSIDPNQPLFALSTMERYFDDRATKTLTVLTAMVAGMGLLGLALALSGLYAVMAWSVARRTREIGIRMAIGADRVTVLGMVMKQGLRLSAIGIIIGLVLSVVFSKVLTASSQVPSFSMPMLFLVALSLLAMALLGALVPARRASRLDPIVVLRQD